MELQNIASKMRELAKEYYINDREYNELLVKIQEKAQHGWFSLEVKEISEGVLTVLNNDGFDIIYDVEDREYRIRW